MGLGWVMAMWVLVAQTTSLQCREAACRPAPGAGMVAVTVSTFATREACEGLRQQMQGTGTRVVRMPTQPGMTFRQSTTLTCQQGE
jgi:hypothetical protein